MTKTTLKLEVKRGEIEEVEGYLYKDGNKTLFVHKRGNYWSVSEPNTGLAILRESKSTRKAAMGRATEVIKLSMKVSPRPWSKLIEREEPMNKGFQVKVFKPMLTPILEAVDLPF